MHSNWSYSPETVILGLDPCDFDLWPLTLIFGLDITSAIGNYSWKFHDDTMTGTLWKKVSETDGQTDIAILRAAWSQLKIISQGLIYGMNKSILYTVQVHFDHNTHTHTHAHMRVQRKPASSEGFTDNNSK